MVVCQIGDSFGWQVLAGGRPSADVCIYVHVTLVVTLVATPCLLTRLILTLVVTLVAATVRRHAPPTDRFSLVPTAFLDGSQTLCLPTKSLPGSSTAAY